MFYFKLRKTNRILKGSIWINGSKSESNRLLIIKNIYYNLINIENLSNSEDTKSKKTYIPYVIETSIGLDRMFLSVFSYSLKKEKKPNGNIRIVLKIPSFLAPLKGAILPLINNDGLPDIAKKIYKVLKLDYDILYEEKESIGKRYRIQDALGTPFCFTIDHKTSENETVTVRFRDTMEQNRIHINDIPTFLKESTERKTILKKLI